MRLAPDLAGARDRIAWFQADADTRRRVLAAVATSAAGEPGLIAAYVHGSFGRGEQAFRDIDVGLVGIPKPGRELWDIATRMRHGLEAAGDLSGAPFDVRPVPWDEPLYALSVIRDGVRVHERTVQERAAFETQVISRWIDFKPDHERLRRAYLERLRRARR